MGRSELLKVSDLNKQHKNNIIKDVFKELLNETYKKIQNANNNKLSYIVHYVPAIKIGYPLYDVRSATFYIYKKLFKGGFKIQYKEPNILCVSW